MRAWLSRCGAFGVLALAGGLVWLASGWGPGAGPPGAVHAPAAAALAAKPGSGPYVTAEGEVGRHLAEHDGCDVRRCRGLRAIVSRLGLDRPAPPRP